MTTTKGQHGLLSITEHEDSWAVPSAFVTPAAYRAHLS